MRSKLSHLWLKRCDWTVTSFEVTLSVEGHQTNMFYYYYLIRKSVLRIWLLNQLYPCLDLGCIIGLVCWPHLLDLKKLHSCWACQKVCTGRMEIYVYVTIYIFIVQKIFYCFYRIYSTYLHNFNLLAFSNDSVAIRRPSALFNTILSIGTSTRLSFTK